MPNNPDEPVTAPPAADPLAGQPSTSSDLEEQQKAAEAARRSRIMQSYASSIKRSLTADPNVDPFAIRPSVDVLGKPIRDLSARTGPPKVGPLPPTAEAAPADSAGSAPVFTAPDSGERGQTRSDVAPAAAAPAGLSLDAVNAALAADIGRGAADGDLWVSAATDPNTGAPLLDVRGTIAKVRPYYLARVSQRLGATATRQQLLETADNEIMDKIASVIGAGAPLPIVNTADPQTSNVSAWIERLFPGPSQERLTFGSLGSIPNPLSVVARAEEAVSEAVLRPIWERLPDLPASDLQWKDLPPVSRLSVDAALIMPRAALSGLLSINPIVTDGKITREMVDDSKTGLLTWALRPLSAASTGLAAALKFGDASSPEAIEFYRRGGDITSAVPEIQALVTPIVTAQQAVDDVFGDWWIRPAEAALALRDLFRGDDDPAPGAGVGEAGQMERQIRDEARTLAWITAIGTNFVEPDPVGAVASGLVLAARGVATGRRAARYVAIANALDEARTAAGAVIAGAPDAVRAGVRAPPPVGVANAPGAAQRVIGDGFRIITDRLGRGAIAAGVTRVLDPIYAARMAVDAQVVSAIGNVVQQAEAAAAALPGLRATLAAAQGAHNAAVAAQALATGQINAAHHQWMLSYARRVTAERQLGRHMASNLSGIRDIATANRITAQAARLWRQERRLSAAWAAANARVAALQAQLRRAVAGSPAAAAFTRDLAREQARATRFHAAIYGPGGVMTQQHALSGALTVANQAIAFDRVVSAARTQERASVGALRAARAANRTALNYRPPAALTRAVNAVWTAEEAARQGGRAIVAWQDTLRDFSDAFRGAAGRLTPPGGVAARAAGGGVALRPAAYAEDIVRLFEAELVNPDAIVARGGGRWMNSAREYALMVLDPDGAVLRSQMAEMSPRLARIALGAKDTLQAMRAELYHITQGSADRVASVYAYVDSVAPIAGAGGRSGRASIWNAGPDTLFMTARSQIIAMRAVAGDRGVGGMTSATAIRALAASIMGHADRESAVGELTAAALGTATQPGIIDRVASLEQFQSEMRRFAVARNISLSTNPERDAIIGAYAVFQSAALDQTARRIAREFGSLTVEGARAANAILYRETGTVTGAINLRAGVRVLADLGMPVTQQRLVARGTSIDKRLTAVAGDFDQASASWRHFFMPQTAMAAIESTLDDIVKQVDVYNPQDRERSLLGDVWLSSWHLYKRDLVNGTAPFIRFAQWANQFVGDVSQVYLRRGSAAATRVGFTSAFVNIPGLDAIVQRGAEALGARGITLTAAVYNPYVGQIARGDHGFVRDAAGRNWSYDELRRLITQESIDATQVGEELLSEARSAVARLEGDLGAVGRAYGRLSRLTEDFAEYCQNRMRMSLFLEEVINRGATPAEAGQIVRSTLYDWRHGFARGELNSLAATVIPFYRFSRLALTQVAQVFLEPFVRPDVGAAMLGRSQMARLRNTHIATNKLPQWMVEAAYGDPSWGNDQASARERFDAFGRAIHPEFTGGRIHWQTGGIDWLSAYYREKGYKNPTNLAWMAPPTTAIDMSTMILAPLSMIFAGAMSAGSSEYVVPVDWTARLGKTFTPLMGDWTEQMYTAWLASHDPTVDFMGSTDGTTVVSPGEAWIYGSAVNAGKRSAEWFRTMPFAGELVDGAGVTFEDYDPVDRRPGGAVQRPRMTWGARTAMRLIPVIGTNMPRFVDAAMLMRAGIDAGQWQHGVAMALGTHIGIRAYPYDPGDQLKWAISDRQSSLRRLEKTEGSAGATAAAGLQRAEGVR